MRKSRWLRRTCAGLVLGLTAGLATQVPATSATAATPTPSQPAVINSLVQSYRQSIYDPRYSISTRDAQNGMAATRALLTDLASFGPGGTVRRALTIGSGISEITEASLAGTDVFVQGFVDLSPAEDVVVRSFVQRGGAALLTGDVPVTSTAPTFGFGQGAGPDRGHTAPFPGTITGPAHRITDGPFGAVSSYQTWYNVSSFTSVPSHATTLGTVAETGGPRSNLAVIERDALAPGSGPVVLTGDVDMFAAFPSRPNNPHDAATANANLIRNIFAFLTTEPAPLAVEAASVASSGETDEVAISAEVSGGTGATSVSWTVVAGDCTIDDPASAHTSFRCDNDGTVVLRVTATDASGATASDDVSIALSNEAPEPTANATASPSTITSGDTTIVAAPFSDVRGDLPLQCEAKEGTVVLATTTSDADGVCSVTVQPTVVGTHGIELYAIDADGARSQAAVATVEVTAPPQPQSKDDCKKDGWRRYSDPSFKNQGDCVSWVNQNS